MKKILFLLLSAFIATQAFAATKTVEVVGEAQIVKNDIASAKIQAESRARWAAMEATAQVKVTASSVVHDAALLDEMIKSEVKGGVTDFKVIDEGKDGDIYWVKAKVTVEAEKAQESMSKLSMNTKIAVYLPEIMTDGKVVESHPFSEEVITQLINKGFEVVDLSSQNDPEFSKKLLEAAQKNDMVSVRKYASQFMAGATLVGKVKVVDKGQDVGYTKINFSIVDGEVDYRLIGSKNGTNTILTSGTVTGRGQGATPEAAAYALSKGLATKKSNQVVSSVSTKLLGDNKKSIRVVMAGNRDMQQFNELRETVKNISWVLNVKEAGVDTLILDYPEKTLYLASIIRSKGG